MCSVKFFIILTISVNLISCQVQLVNRRQVKIFKVLGNTASAYTKESMRCTQNTKKWHHPLTEFDIFLYEPSRDSPKLGQILELISELRNESVNLRNEFDRKFAQTSWEDFSSLNQWQMNLYFCYYNIMVADKVSMMLLSIKTGLRPLGEPGDLTQFNFLNDLIPDHTASTNKDLLRILENTSIVSNLIWQYFHSRIYKSQVLTALDQLALDAAKLKQALEASLFEAYRRNAPTGRVIVPVDEASMRSTLRYITWLASFVVEYRRKFADNL